MGESNRTKQMAKGSGDTLIVVVRPGTPFVAVQRLARRLEFQVAPLFGPIPKRLRKERRMSPHLRNLPVFYRVEAPQARLRKLAQRLLTVKLVQGAYVKGPAELPAMVADICKPKPHAPPVTPNFQPIQGYLRRSPGGINAKFAWKKHGGTGFGVKIMDVERSWRFTHEDILGNSGGVVAGYPPNDESMKNHGTAVSGILRADRNSFGVTGICPDANLRAVSTFDAAGHEDTASAIFQATFFLSPGDIMLLEMHRKGPPDYEGGEKYIPVEWWPCDLVAIKFATSLGVIVVEAAGNGFSDLDDPLYNNPKTGFPPFWKNPFNRSNVDSGAIVVGAGAPPVGDWGKDRSRLDFSDYGAMVDAQGWGREVVTMGFGCLQGGSDKNRWYMDEFGGTSGAVPMVAGALGCVQGRLRVLGKKLLGPAQARQLLRSTGSPQQDGAYPTSQRIGNRPNLKEMFKVLGLNHGRSVSRNKTSNK